jgi:hypothetical protein
LLGRVRANAPGDNKLSGPVQGAVSKGCAAAPRNHGPPLFSPAPIMARILTLVPIDYADWHDGRITICPASPDEWQDDLVIEDIGERLLDRAAGDESRQDERRHHGRLRAVLPGPRRGLTARAITHRRWTARAD